MINKTELRIGNWVIGRDYSKRADKVEVESIDDGGINLSACYDGGIDRDFTLEEIFPIPLTPEILLACGFEDLHGEACPHYRKEQLEIEIIPNGEYNARLRWDWEESGISLLLSKLSHLHQLQNLYFALTGTELEYKP